MESDYRAQSYCAEGNNYDCQDGTQRAKLVDTAMEPDSRRGTVWQDPLPLDPAHTVAWEHVLFVPLLLPNFPAGVYRVAVLKVQKLYVNHIPM